MKRYRVWFEYTEQRTRYHENWTEQELLDAYNAETTCDPLTVRMFQTEQEALEYYNGSIPTPPTEHPVSVGRVINYEVIGIDEEEVDEDGEVIESYTACMKVSPLVYEDENDEEI